MLVAWREALPLRDDPDLEEVNRLGLRGIELRVSDACARRHALHVAGPDQRARPKAVLVLERAFKDIGDDLHVAVRMRGESAARRHAVVIDDAQRAETHVLRVVIVPERKTVLAVKPTEFARPRSSDLRIVSVMSLLLAAEVTARFQEKWSGAKVASMPRKLVNLNPFWLQ